MDAVTRAAWLEDRRKSLGASDVPAVLGFNPWKSPYSVWASKVHAVDGVAGEAADVGHWLEAPIFEMWRAKLMGRDLGLGEGDAYEVEQPGLIRPPSAPWAHATPDYVIVSDGRPYVVQIKSVGSSNQVRKWSRLGGLESDVTPVAQPETEEHGTVPVAYYLQTLWEMWVTEQVYGVRPPFGLLVALVPDGGFGLRSFRVDYDVDLVDDMVRYCGDWWRRHVRGGLVPDVSASDGDTLARLNPIVRGTIELDAEVARSVEGYQQAQRRRRHASDCADTHKHILIEALGAAKAGIVEMPDGERLHVSQTRREGKRGPYSTISIRPAGNRRPSADLADYDWSI